VAYIPATSHVTLLATLRRDRLLPVAGEVIVEPRQRLEASDVVARALLPEHHKLVDIARKLGLPPEKADSAMLKEDGDTVKAGEAIARRKTLLGLLPRTARSPVEGRLVAAAGGKALVAAMSQPYELRAGVPGMVVSILQGRGVVLETTGALVEGVWGNGQEDFAPLRLAGSDANQELTANAVDMSMRGALLVAGRLTDPAALKRVADVGVRGLVVGMLVASLLPTAATLSFPVLVVEGFGQGAFSEPVQALLTTSAGRQAWVHAVARDRFTGRRPELIIPLASPGAPPPAVTDGDVLKVGKRVRVLRGPAAGRVGTVTALNERPVPLPSGIRSRAAMVAFPGEAGPPVRVPYANLELLE
jgi:hypothetical protein